MGARIFILLCALLLTDRIGAQMTALPVWNQRLITVDYTASSGAFTVPANVNRLVSIEVWGAGGSAAREFGTNYSYGGGGGGAYSRVTNIPVTPGATFAFVVGTGGAAASSGYVGNPGGASWFYSASFLYAEGGFGSTGNFNGGSGGRASYGFGELVRSGGDGGSGNNANKWGGGGGGAASPSGSGENGQDNGSPGSKGGDSPDAGTGGAGGSGSNSAGGPGIAHIDGGGGGGGGGENKQGGVGGYPGGGGGASGGYYGGSSTGAGASGKLRIRYYAR